jgi:Family of unknown function (DUF5709)
MSQSDEEWDDVEDEGVLDDSDTLDGEGDPLDTGVAAADRWSGANRFGTTVSEQRAGEPLDQKLAEEEPDVDPYADPAPDSDEDELTPRGWETQPRAGRLVEEDEGFGEDDEPDSVARDVGIDAGGASAEEAAVHVVDEPDSPGDGPLR